MLKDLINWLKAMLAMLAMWTRAIGDKGEEVFARGFKNYIQAMVDIIVPIIRGASPGLRTIVDGLTEVFQTFGGPMKGDLDAAITPVARAIIDETAAAQLSAGQSTPDAAVARAAAAFSGAFANGISSAAVTAAFEILMPEKLSTLNGVGPMLSKMAGFDQIAEAVLEPLYANAFGKALDYHYRSQFKPEFADEQDAVEWHSRRLLSEADLREVFKWSGLKAKYEDAFVASAYRSLSPRVIATMFDDTDFDTSAARPALEFMGYRDQDIDLTLRALEHASLKSLRAGVKTDAEALFVDGLYDEVDLDEALDAIGMRVEARHLVLQSARMKRLAKLGADLVAAAKSEYESGEGTVEGYRAALAGAGYVPPLLDALVGTEQAKVTAAVFKKENAALQAEIRKAQTVSIDALRTAYHNREISIEAFTAGLLAIGVPPGTAAAFTSLELARPQAKQPAPKKLPPKKKP